MSTLHRCLPGALCVAGALALVSAVRLAGTGLGRPRSLQSPKVRTSGGFFRRSTPSHTPTAVPAFTVTDLGTLGGSSSDAYAINNRGQVVGMSLTGEGKEHAFLHGDGAMKDLGTLGGGFSRAAGINDPGQVVGQAMTAEGVHHAFLYSNGRMKDLGTLGANPSAARSINNAGQVVGWSATPGPGVHAFLSSGGVMRDLGTLGGSESEAYGINAFGQVAGSSGTAQPDTRAFLYSGGMDELRTAAADSVASSINDAGQVAGWFSTAGGDIHGFFYSDGVVTDLTAPGGGYSKAFSISSSGLVVGRSDVHAEGGAFLYTGGVIMDLNRCIPSGSGWALLEARGINDASQIVGLGCHNGDYRAFLLTPKPSACREITLRRRARQG